MRENFTHYRFLKNPKCKFVGFSQKNSAGIKHAFGIFAPEYDMKLHVAEQRDWALVVGQTLTAGREGEFANALSSRCNWAPQEKKPLRKENKP
jgi:hypothetical protein